MLRFWLNILLKYLRFKRENCYIKRKTGVEEIIADNQDKECFPDVNSELKNKIIKEIIDEFHYIKYKINKWAITCHFMKRDPL